MPRALAETTQFKTDKKRIKRSGRYDWEKMRQVVKELMNDRCPRNTATTNSRAITRECGNAISRLTGC